MRSPGAGALLGLSLALLGAGASCKDGDGREPRSPPARAESDQDAPSADAGVEEAAPEAGYPLAGELQPRGAFGLPLGLSRAAFSARFPNAEEQPTGLVPFSARPGIASEAFFLDDELALLMVHPCARPGACGETGRSPADLEPVCGGEPTTFPAPRGQLNQVQACVDEERVIFRSAGPTSPVVYVSRRLLPGALTALAAEQAGRRCAIEVDLSGAPDRYRSARVRKQVSLAATAFAGLPGGLDAEVKARADKTWRLQLTGRRRGCAGR